MVLEAFGESLPGMADGFHSHPQGGAGVLRGSGSELSTGPFLRGCK